MQTQKQLFCIQKTFVLKQAEHIGAEKKIVQLGIAAIKNGSRIRLVFIKRRLLQTRIN